MAQENRKHTQAISAIEGIGKDYNPYEKWEHLFEMQEHLEKVGDKSIDDIYLLVSDREYTLHQGRKIAHINHRHLCNLHLEDTSNQKIGVYRQSLTTCLSAASVFFEVIGAIHGPGFSMVARVISASKDNVERTSRSVEEKLGHIYQRAFEITKEHSQEVQNAKRRHEEVISKKDQHDDSQQRLAQLVAGGG